MKLMDLYPKTLIQKPQMIKTATKVVCDHCNKEIKLRPKDVKTKMVEYDVERSYFKCKHCNTKHTIAYANNKFKSNIQQMNDIFKKLQDKALTKKEAKSLVDKKDNLIKQNKVISQRYRNIYETSK